MSDKVESRAFAIYEDNPDWLSILSSALVGRGHTVPIIISERDEALASIGRRNYKKLGIFGAIVDGNLISNHNFNEDGIAIVDAILALNMGIHVFSIASEKLVRAEFVLSKGDPNIEATLNKYLKTIGA